MNPAVREHKRHDAEMRVQPTKASPFRVRLAEPRDDAAIRHVLRQRAMAGSVQLTFEREPSYFESLDRECLRHDTVLIEDVRDGSIIAMGARQVHHAWTEGGPARVGYLSQLRMVEGSRRPLKAARDAWRMINSCRSKDELPYDVTSVAVENASARRLLERGAPGQPRYHPLTEYVVHAVPTTIRQGRARDVEICEADDAAWRDVKGLHSRRVRSATLAMGGHDDDGLAIRLAALRNGRVVAGIGVEDARAWRQFVVRGYEGVLRWFRPAINLAMHVHGAPRLPGVGEPLPCASITCMGFQDGCESAITSLLRHAAHRARRLGIALLLVGGVAGDPLTARIARSFRTRSYRTMLYAVEWASHPDAITRLKRGDLQMELRVL